MLAGVLGAAACAGTEAETPSAVETVRSVPVRTATVQTRDLAETLSLTGTLDPRSEVTVVPEISARLERVLKNEGDRVAPRSAARRPRRRRFQARARSREGHTSTWPRRTARTRRAEKDRADSLLKTGGITDKDHLAAQVAVQVAEASHAQARSELAITERQMGRTQITAPISGRIAKRHADAGTIVAAGTPLYTIVDDSVFEFRSSVASGDFGKVQGRRERRRHRRRAAGLRRPRAR